MTTFDEQDHRAPNDPAQGQRDASPIHDDAFARYARANHYVNEGLIRLDSARAAHDGPPRSRRQWMESFLPQLGSPEQAFSAIHVAGTSGKGSVCAMLAAILHAAGYRTGLHLSPYVQVATEKLWIDGRYASADAYEDLVQWIRPHAERWRGEDVPLHGIVSVALFLQYFKRQAVELGVVEVGVGGREDLTNVVNTSLAVITNVGLDHQRTLGPTLEQIAWHKVGIIVPGCRAVVFASDRHDPLLAAAERQARAVQAPLRVVFPDQVAIRVRAHGDVRLDFRGHRLRVTDVELAMGGRFQAYNAALAMAACEQIDPTGRRLDESAIRRGLRAARLPARLERIDPTSPVADPPPCPLIIDGAHNADKLAATARHLAAHTDGRVHLVVGSLHAKADSPALHQLVQRASTVTVAEPRVYGKQARDAAEVAAVLSRHAPGRIEVRRCGHAAARHALDAATPRDLVVVTGSLYLAGDVRSLWYPAVDVLRRRTSWP